MRNSKNDESGNYKASDQIYVTATEGSADQVFSYWTKQDSDSTSPVFDYKNLL